MKIPGSPVQRTLLRRLRDLIDEDSQLREVHTVDHRQIPRVIVESVESDDWASLTFIGEVHRIDLRLTGGDAIDGVHARLDALLAVADIAVPGHIVAEIAVVAVEACADGVVVSIEALTLEE